MSEIHVDVEGRTLRLSNLDKVLYPRTGTTKGEILNYYARIAPVLLPHLKDRAVTRIRWPNGVQEMSFFEKNAPAGTPSWVRTARVPTSGSRGESRNGDHLIFPIVDDLATLTCWPTWPPWSCTCTSGRWVATGSRATPTGW